MKSIYFSLCSLLMFLGVFAFTNCGSDEHVAEFDTEAQGSPEDVSLLLRRLQYGYQEDNDSLEGDSIFEGWNPDRTERLWIDRTNWKERGVTDSARFFRVQEAEVRAVARLSKSTYEDFDGKFCCFLSQYDPDGSGHEYLRVFCPLPPDATKEQFAVGSSVSFRFVRTTDRLRYHQAVPPTELIAEIELVATDDATE